MDGTNRYNISVLFLGNIRMFIEMMEAKVKKKEIDFGIK